MPETELPIVLAVTGASGAIYGLRLAQMLLDRGIPLYLLASRTGKEVVQMETERPMDDWLAELGALGPLQTPAADEFSAPIASGSALTRGMVIAPCSMGTLGRIAAGTSGSLIERSAEICLKERRRLILLVRETPLSSIHIENMLKVSGAGGIIMPPVPAFYTRPRSIEDIVDQTAYRVLDLLGLPSEEAKRWNI